MTEKGLRLDLGIALCALVLSALAAGAATYQTYVINQQYSASVWPYLVFVTSANNHFVETDIKNVGIGPALIRSALVLRDGKPLVDAPDGSMTALGRAIAPDLAAADADRARARAGDKIDTSVSSINAGDVIPAGERQLLVRVDGSYIVRHIVADRARFDIALCYCSLLGQCWTKHLKDSRGEPASVRRCPQA